MSHRVRTAVSAAVLAVTSAAALAVTAAPASAAPAGEGATFTVTLTRTAAAGLGAQEVITCGGSVGYPWVLGIDVRVDVFASCDAPVDLISVAAGVEADGVLVADNGGTRAATSSHSVASTYQCLGTTKTYRGVGVVTFTKYGYQGSPLTMGGATPRITLSC
ncbi:hypothetical protein [Lentzea sp.]|uniref:hypothetical protein n=1 Tax=Lentzea sp. TaxID=56099 RepID=UPI002ED1B111